HPRRRRCKSWPPPCAGCGCAASPYRRRWKPSTASCSQRITPNTQASTGHNSCHAGHAWRRYRKEITMNRHTAELYDYTSRLIAHCHNTPQAIAKAAMEHPEVRFFKAWGSGGMRHISAVQAYMTDANSTASGYVAVPGVVPAVD